MIGYEKSAVQISLRCFTPSCKRRTGPLRYIYLSKHDAEKRKACLLNSSDAFPRYENGALMCAQLPGKLDSVVLAGLTEHIELYCLHI